MITILKNKNFIKVAMFACALSLMLVASLALAQGTNANLPNFAPSTATTTTGCTASGIGGLICKVHQMLNSIIPVLVTLGLVYFVWNVVQYMIADSDEAKKKGRDSIIYGILGLAVIVGLWGILAMVVKTFGLGGNNLSIQALSASNSGACTALNSTARLGNLLDYVTCMIERSVIPLLFALAFAYFIWGAVQFVAFAGGEEAKRTQGRQHMIWGIIALAVMFGVWGLVRVVGDTFGLETRVLPKVGP